MSNLIIDKEKFNQEGYLIVPNVFSPSEIAQLRTLSYEQYEIDKSKKLDFTLPNVATKAKYNKGDLLSKEKLYHVLLDDRILKIARTILGSNDIIYFGDSSYQIGTGQRGFHRDNIDRTNLDGPDWKGEYTLVRLGLYLQNHKEYSGGLKIKVGSHKNANGKPVFVGNEVGDVVLWNLRTLHSGNAVRLKFFPNFSINRAGREGMVPSFLKKDEQQERISFFMTFGIRSNHLDRYIQEYSLKRKDMLEDLRASKYTGGVLELAKQKQLEVIKLLPEQNEVAN
jgi:hypothetical protein